MIDMATIGEDTYTSSLPWSTISSSSYQPTAALSPKEIGMLRKDFYERSSKDPQYQAYLHDLHILDQIRKKKTVSLQDSAFKSETETMKQIETQWVQDPDSTKREINKDAILNQSAAIVADMAMQHAVKR